MQDLPLHPVVVHLPIGLAVATPIVALLVFVAIVRNWLPARAWLVIVVLQALLMGGAAIALKSGEQDEEKVEDVVAHEHIEAHEDAARWFPWGAGLVLLAALAGLQLPGRGGRIAMGVTVVASLGLLAMAVRVGHSGGKLVYVHGAAQAHTGPVTAPPPGERGGDE